LTYILPSSDPNLRISSYLVSTRHKNTKHETKNPILPTINSKMDPKKVLQNYKRLLSIIKQFNVTGRTSNWELVAKDLELVKKGTVNKRWS